MSTPPPWPIAPRREMALVIVCAQILQVWPAGDFHPGPEHRRPATAERILEAVPYLGFTYEIALKKIQRWLGLPC